MKKSLGLLLGVSVGLWLIAAYPAHKLWGETALVYSAVALVLCLVPTGATMLWASKDLVGPADQQMVVILGGTAARMVFVLGIGLLLYFSMPYFQQPGFWFCLLIAYLFTLTFEMVLLRRHLAAGDR